MCVMTACCAVANLYVLASSRRRVIANIDSHPENATVFRVLISTSFRLDRILSSFRPLSDQYRSIAVSAQIVSKTYFRTVRNDLRCCFCRSWRIGRKKRERERERERKRRRRRRKKQGKKKNEGNYLAPRTLGC